MWCVYVLHHEGVLVPVAGKKGNRDSYVGMTNRLEYRVAQHNAGNVAATRGRSWQLVAFLSLSDRSSAALCERWLKCGNSREKRQLLALHTDSDKAVLPAMSAEILDRVILWNNARQERMFLANSRRV